MKLLRTLLIALTVFAAWGCLTAASAMTMTPLAIGSEDTLQIQLSCDQYGRCFRSAPRYYDDDDDGYAPRYRTWNGCPYGYTVQGGECRPYQGPTGYYGYERRRGYEDGYERRRSGGGGCPYGYTVQGGRCQPYRGPY